MRHSNNKGKQEKNKLVGRPAEERPRDRNPLPPGEVLPPLRNPPPPPDFLPRVEADPMKVLVSGRCLMVSLLSKAPSSAVEADSLDKPSFPDGGEYLKSIVEICYSVSWWLFIVCKKKVCMVRTRTSRTKIAYDFFDFCQLRQIPPLGMAT